MRRTTNALIGALVSLVLEKRYDRITIQDLLDRADVGRSTFYSHYRGKDDFLLRSFAQMLDLLDRSMTDDEKASGGRIAPVRELFDHVGRMRRFHEALARARMIDRLYQVGVERLSATIERRLAARAAASCEGADRAEPASASRSVRRAAPIPLPVPHAVAARAHAGALFALLRWWIAQGASYTPERMDEMFHAMLERR